MSPSGFLHRLAGARQALDALADCLPQTEAAIRVIADSLRAGGTIYTVGNGGSAAEALHLAEELIGCYRDRERIPLRAVCLNADPTALTCIANDFGYEEVFARQCRALLRAEDVLVVLSTSGQSPNVLRALQVARDCGATSIGLLGRDGGSCLARCDHAIVIPMDDAGHVQEAHLVVVHMICDELEGSRGEDSESR